MKRITVTVTVEDDWNRDQHRWMKDEMITAAMARVSKSALSVVSIEAKIGTPRKVKP